MSYTWDNGNNFFINYQRQKDYLKTLVNLLHWDTYTVNINI